MPIVTRVEQRVPTIKAPTIKDGRDGFVVVARRLLVDIAAARRRAEGRFGAIETGVRALRRDGESLRHEVEALTRDVRALRAEFGIGMAWMRQAVEASLTGGGTVTDDGLVNDGVQTPVAAGAPPVSGASPPLAYGEDNADRVGVRMSVPVQIVGRRLPGSSWSGRHNIHIGVQRGAEVVGVVSGGGAEFEDVYFDVEIDIVPGSGVEGDTRPDFRGPFVQGRRGERFIYLAWGEVDEAGVFTMFRRLKLHLSPLEQFGGDQLLATPRIQAVLELTDAKGRPQAASVRPPWVTWRLLPS